MMNRKTWVCLIAVAVLFAIPCLGDGESDRDIDRDVTTVPDRDPDQGTIATVSGEVCANTCWNYWYKKCSSAGLGGNTCSEYAGWQTSNGNCANYHADTAECTASAAS